MPIASQTLWLCGCVVILRVASFIELGHNSTKYPPPLLSKASTVISVKGLSAVTTTAILVLSVGSIPAAITVFCDCRVKLVLFLQSSVTDI